MTAHSGFENAQDAIDFITGGNALFTLTSAKSGNHYTFKAQRPKSDQGDPPIFVKVLTGPDNSWNGDWLFLGTMFSVDGDVIASLVPGRKGHPNAASFKALDWALRHMTARNVIPGDLTIQHEGRCCRCNRVLTHPASTSSGIGPECAKK